jgi:uncharacterized protein (TIGR02271 family)
LVTKYNVIDYMSHGWLVANELEVAMNDYRTSIINGMLVRSVDGERLGKVYRLDSDFFFIEKGLFFPKDYAVRYEDVQEVRNGEVFLRQGVDLLSDLSNETYLSDDRTTSERPDLNRQPGINFGENRNDVTKTREELRVPLVEEEISVEHHTREAGAVRVRKEVVTEQKQVTVPVKHEEIVVERVAVPPGTPADEIDTAFDEKEVVVSAQEEVVEIHKRPVVREEVRIHKQVTEEQQTADTTVRREEAKIEDKTTNNTRKAPIIKEDVPKPRHR